MQKYINFEKDFFWVGGKNASLEIIKSKKRLIKECLCTENFVKKNKITIKHHITTNDSINKHFNNDFSHQGIALKVGKIKTYSLKNIIQKTISKKKITLIILDGLTDQGNIGSIIRTAYAFNADGIIIEKKYFNQKNQHCIKSSSGAIEHLKIIPVTNINNEIKYLKNHNFWIYSLDQYSNNIFYKEKFASKRAFVFGSEGKGIKNMTKSLCDISLKININSKSESLNVSSAVSACLHGIEILDNI